ncbi:hypothetical protein [Micromonospora sp. WMMD1082]|uniref:hypothetical protein n=1 Tax=Micromonospora sp. WMMD1082 TaxID=3016104 RepID=UPI002417FA1E|nr:hypothetical protein [Micromonospora sp. WMMD1082]MDG4796919.1 hypothetical protein [Micromonospora sp. WMMD1082]
MQAIAANDSTSPVSEYSLKTAAEIADIQKGRRDDPDLDHAQKIIAGPPPGRWV